MKYTCDGEDINPLLLIAGVPDGTVTLALIVDDPDAPGGTWDHWVLWNIDPQTKIIKENSVPAGAIAGTNSAGKLEFHGPCPPSGTHRYFFKLYALNKELDLEEGATKEQLEKSMAGYIIEKAEVMGKYIRA